MNKAAKRKAAKGPKVRPDRPQGRTYRSAVVTFLDVLGFRELVRLRSADEMLEIVHLMQKFASSSDSDLVHELNMEDDISWTRTVAFSDSVARVRPFDLPYSDGSLFHEILDLVHAQADLANHGVIVRGGLTVGQVFLESNTVFGPAFVRAYDLESQYANVPRIVVGPEVFKELRNDPQLRAEHHDLKDEIGYLKRLLRRGDDGFWFIDYFKAIAREMDEPDAQYPMFAEAHRELIVKNARSVPEHGRALQKYLWLSEYHNSVCREWGGQAKKFCITAADIPAFETLPEADNENSD